MDPGNKRRQQEIDDINRLLTKFRLDWDEGPIIVDIKKTAPSQETKEQFKSFLNKAGHTEKDPRPHITDRWLRVSEVIGQRTRESDDCRLCIISMPYPRDDSPTSIYLGILEMLSRDMPPTIVMRGNNRNCLTFYSE